VEAGFEGECGWQDVFGQPFIVVPEGVWKMHTKQEKKRAKDRMVDAILKEMPETKEARATAERMASCFMRFTTVPRDYTPEAMKQFMVQFLKNSVDFERQRADLMVFSEREYGEKVEQYKAEGQVPRIPIKFDNDNTLHFRSGTTKQARAGTVYDLYDMVHPTNPGDQIQGFVGGFCIQRHVMRFWWYARVEYARYVRDTEDFHRLCVDQELFDGLVQHGFYSFEIRHTMRTSASLMRSRFLSFDTDEYPTSQEDSSTLPTPKRPEKKRRITQTNTKKK